MLEKETKSAGEERRDKKKENMSETMKVDCKGKRVRERRRNGMDGHQPKARKRMPREHMSWYFGFVTQTQTP